MLNINQQQVTLSHTSHGSLYGKGIYLVTLNNGKIEVSITNLGCTITAIHTPDREGALANIVAGYRHPGQYRQNDYYFGCVVGRYANRIAGGKFAIGHEQYQLSVNNGTNHLHGGVEGFHTKVWAITSFIRREKESGVMFEYLSPDGEEGYPGNMRVKVKYLLDSDNRLHITYHAVADKQTPVNLTNHSYFNLTGFDTPVITGHLLQLDAVQYTEKNAENVPTGNILSVAGTPLDFSKPARIGDGIDQFPADRGYDHNFILTHAGSKVIPAAILSDAGTGRILRVYTDKPAIQVYTANWWDGTIRGQQGQMYGQHGAVALETQSFPDSPNHSRFPNTLLSPGQAYDSWTTFEFAV